MNVISRKAFEVVRAVQMFTWMLVTFWRQINGRLFYFRDCPDWFVERMARLAARDNDSDQIRAYVEDAKNEFALRQRRE